MPKGPLQGFLNAPTVRRPIDSSLPSAGGALASLIKSAAPSPSASVSFSGLGGAGLGGMAPSGLGGVGLGMPFTMSPELDNSTRGSPPFTKEEIKAGYRVLYRHGQDKCCDSASTGGKRKRRSK